MNMPGLVFLIFFVPITGLCILKGHYIATAVLVLLICLLLKVVTQRGDEEEPREVYDE